MGKLIYNKDPPTKGQSSMPKVPCAKTRVNNVDDIIDGKVVNIGRKTIFFS
jgi:hypothetical protein